MSEYETIFAKRGTHYHSAMLQYPQAREAEFNALFSAINRNTFKNVADIPAGGGYLQGFLADDCLIDYFEPCSTFNSKNYIDLEKVTLPENHYDAVINLAAIHHINNKQAFINALFKALKPQGYLCIGDVLAGSCIANFLDNFSGHYNGTGHSGDYLTLDTFAQIGLTAPYRIIENQVKVCPWVFDDEQALINFCRLLFGLSDISDAVLFSALKEMIGIDYHQAQVHLLWELIYITVQKL
ncbi:MAG: methyltransferase domain-containing protein [Methylococcaceae bacterium]